MSSTPLDSPELQRVRLRYKSFFPKLGDVEQSAFTIAGVLAVYFRVSCPIVPRIKMVANFFVTESGGV